LVPKEEDEKNNHKRAILDALEKQGLTERVSNANINMISTHLSY